jgi:chondroitin-sulfate-ABC endolyase/exolyase
MKKRILMLAAILSCSLSAKDLIDFSGNEVPGYVRAKNSKVQVSDIRSIHGENSLRWDWKKNAALTFNTPIQFKTDAEAYKFIRRTSHGIFSIWVYNTKALPKGKIRFEFGKKGKVNCYFDFNLNFTGWRTCWVAYTRDMKGKPVKGMDFMRIKAPKAASGTLFFDRVILCAPVDYRHQSSDAQVLCVNVKEKNHWTPKLKFFNLAPKKLPRLTGADLKGFAILEKRLRDQLLKGTGAKRFTDLKRDFDKTRITEKNGVIKGRHVKFRSHDVICTGLKGGKKYLKDYLDMRHFYGPLMLNLAVAYNNDPNGKHAGEIKKMYILTAKHVFDQGWAAGSGLGTMHHQGYNTRELFTSLFLMRKQLEESGLLQVASSMTQWFTNIRYIFDKKYWADPNADYFNTMSQSSAMTVIMMPDTPEKVAAIDAFSKFYSRNVGMESPGWMGGFKADGCGFHHWGHYPGYSFGAMRSAAYICYLFSGTPWPMSQKALDNLRRVFYAAYIYSNPDISMGICGRHPFSKSDIRKFKRYFKYLEDADGGKPIITDKNPQGHWTFNYGCFGVHRHKDKVTTIKGYNHFVWSSEIYTRDNRFGRYQSNGAIEIMPKTGPESVGRIQAGWDWNRNPGTTILYRPFEILDSPRYSTLMLTSPSRISGSSNLENKYGAFGVELSEPKMKNFDSEFRAVKSMFCFDDRIICLGSGITAGSKYPVETILTQYNVKDGSVPIYFNSATAITALPFKSEHKPSSWVADPFGNAWFVVSGGKVKVVRQKQRSPHNKTRKIASGNFAAAWIDHGARPKNAGYELLILTDSNPEKSAAYAEKMQKNKPYQVLRSDNSVHAVKDKATHVTAAIFFKPAKNLNWGPLKEVMNPCYVMFKGGHTMSLSINTPNMAGFTGRGNSKAQNKKELQPRQITIILRGKWHTAKLDKRAKIKYIGTSTIITGNFVHGQPIQLKLSHAKHR